MIVRRTLPEVRPGGRHERLLTLSDRGVCVGWGVSTMSAPASARAVQGDERRGPRLVDVTGADRGRADVSIGPFSVSNRGRGDVVAAIVAGARSTAGSRPWTAFALHVGGLNERRNDRYVAAMSAADLVYADGVSIVLAARLAGARTIERCSTTDMGWTVIDELHALLGRPVRVALIGGVDGLARRAAGVIEERCAATVVLAEHGYHDDWSETLALARAADPDVLIVGLGAPAEMIWATQHHSLLPPCLVLTCGGWFGFIVGDERRAPAIVQALGLEWVFRLVQAPRRLARRYSQGLASMTWVVASVGHRRVRAVLARRSPSGAPLPLPVPRDGDAMVIDLRSRDVSPPVPSSSSGTSR